MTEVTEKEFEDNFDQYMDRIEKGEEFLIRLPDGRAVAAVPVDEEIQKILDIMPNIEYDDEVDF
jgi:antitoxin (DNA-binding transcriptional repressor) of toxin-antitoxin stability system